jgi:hypothetical protein
MKFSSARGVFEPPAAKERSTARLSVRLPGLDSSNTWRIAFKSSFAEMMGNSKQESASIDCGDLERGCRSQKQKASGISSSQHRFSSSSKCLFPDTQKTRWANLKPGLKFTYWIIF